MAEQSNSVQNETLQRATDAEARYAKNGQTIALLLTLLAFIASVVFFAVDNALAGVIFVVIPIVMLLRPTSRESSEHD